MRFLNSLYYCTEFFFLCHVNRVFQIHTGYRFIGWNFNNVHTVNIPEFLFFGKRGTGHTGFFVIFVKEVLEGNRRQCLTLSPYLHMLFRLNGLVQTVGITSSRHNTSGKLIDNENLVILYYIILVTEHQIMSTKSQNHIVLDFQVFRVCQVFNVKKLLNLFHTLFGEVYNLVLFIDNKVSGLDNLLTHNSGHLCHFPTGFSTLQLLCQNIADFIKLRGFAALSGNNKRCTGFVNQYRVHLIDDGIV